MHIVFTARDVEISSEVQHYMEEKARKLLKYFDHIQEIRIIAGIVDKQARVEMQVDVEHGHDAVSHASSDDFRKSADLVVDKLSAQLSKLKSNLKDHHRTPLKEASRVQAG